MTLPLGGVHLQFPAATPGRNLGQSASRVTSPCASCSFGSSCSSTFCSLNPLLLHTEVPAGYWNRIVACPSVCTILDCSAHSGLALLVSFHIVSILHLATYWYPSPLWLTPDFSFCLSSSHLSSILLCHFITSTT